MLGALPASAQIIDAHGQYVDTVFNDHVDRTVEDFVIASLVVADPGTFMYSVLGHACLRLQCPTFDMDYCFSYESENERDKVRKFLAGKLIMGLFAIPTKDYCDLYFVEGRGVYEYELNLPINVKRELWRVIDDHLAEGIRLPYDYYNRGCAIAIVDFLKEALGEKEIVYDKSLYDYSPTGRDLVKANTTRALWVRFIACFLAGSEVDEPLIGDKQLLVPVDLVRAWQKAKVDGEYLLASKPNVLVEGKPQVNDGWFTPMVLAIILLMFSIINLWVKYPYFDWLMLALQTFVACGMVYLIVFSDLCCTDWNWLVVPFNPLPIICWKWRKYWATLYAGLLALWCVVMIAMTIWVHVLADWNHIVMVLSWMLIVIKQSKLFIHCQDVMENRM